MSSSNSSKEKIPSPFRSRLLKYATTERLASRCLVKKGFLAKEIETFGWRIQGRGPGPAPSSLIFRPNWGPNGRKHFLETAPPFSKGLDTPPPPHPPRRYVKVWIRHCLLSLLIDLKTSTTTSTRFSQNRELAREQASLILAGKRYSLRHSTTSFSENVVVTEIGQYQILEGLPVSAIGKGLNLLQ